MRRTTGVHPEMLALQDELQKRRDKRLGIAERKKQREDDHIQRMADEATQQLVNEFIEQDRTARDETEKEKSVAWKWEY